MPRSAQHPLAHLLWRVAHAIVAVAEWTGVDWFLLLLGKEPFRLDPNPRMKPQLLRAGAESIAVPESVELALQACERLQMDESERTSNVEAKALHLMGSVGLPSGIVLGAFGFLLQSGMKLPDELSTALFGLFSVSAISLLWAVFLALRVVVVASSPSAAPDPLDVLNLETQDALSWRRDRVADLLVSYSMNVERTNRKATFLVGAQLWFRNAVALLLLLAVVAGVTIPLLT